MLTISHLSKSLGGVTAVHDLDLRVEPEMDVISILRKKRLLVTGYEIVVKGERAQDHPRVYTSIQVEHVVRGKDIPPDAVARAIELSEGKYCPATAILRLGVSIQSSYRVIEDSGTRL